MSMCGIGVLNQPVTPDWKVFNTWDKPSSGVVWTTVTGGNRCPRRYCDGPGALIEKVVGVSVQKVPNYMGMVLVEHDSACRPRGFQSVVFVLV